MKISILEKKEKVTIKVTAKEIGLKDVEEFEKVCLDTILHNKQIVIALDQVEYANSLLLDTLVKVIRKIPKGKNIVFRVSPMLSEILRLTGLDKIIDIC